MTRLRGFIRRHRRAIVTIVAIFVLVVAGTWITVQWISRQQTAESLSRQAAEIAAHRQAQRAEAPVTPPVAAADTTPIAPAAAPPPDAPSVPAIAWTRQWTDFRGARRDGHYSAGPIRT